MWLGICGKAGGCGEGTGFLFEGAVVVAVDETIGEVEAEEGAEAAEAFGLSGVGGFVADE